MNVGDLVRAMETIAPARFASSWDNVGLIVGDEATRSGARAPHDRLHVRSARRSAPRTRRSDRLVSSADLLPGEAVPRRIDRPRRGARRDCDRFSAHRAGRGRRRHERRPRGRPRDDAREPLRRLEHRARAHGDGARRLLSTRRRPGLSSLASSVPSRSGTSSSRAPSIAAVSSRGGMRRERRRFPARRDRPGAQLFLTGELRHHDALRAVAAGLTVVCTLHSASERAALEVLERRLAEATRRRAVSAAGSTASRSYSR